MRMFSTNEIANMFGLTSGYFKNLRHLQAGPRYFRIGRMVRYREGDVQNWLEKIAIEVNPKRLK